MTQVARISEAPPITNGLTTGHTTKECIEQCENWEKKYLKVLF